MSTRIFWIGYCLIIVAAAFFIVSCVSPRPPVVRQPHYDYRESI